MGPWPAHHGPPISRGGRAAGGGPAPRVRRAGADRLRGALRPWTGAQKLGVFCSRNARQHPRPRLTVKTARGPAGWASRRRLQGAALRGPTSGGLCCHQQSEEPRACPAGLAPADSRISLPEELKKDGKIPNYGFCRHFLPGLELPGRQRRNFPGASARGGVPAGAEPPSLRGPLRPATGKPLPRRGLLLREAGDGRVFPCYPGRAGPPGANPPGGLCRRLESAGRRDPWTEAQGCTRRGRRAAWPQRWLRRRAVTHPRLFWVTCLAGRQGHPEGAPYLYTSHVWKTKPMDGDVLV